MDQKVFALRRNRFIEAMQDGLAIFRAAPVSVRNNDVEYPYRQDSDFYYLTGFEEPDAFAVFEKNGAFRKFILFVRPSDKEKEVWTGKRVGLEGAITEYGADEAHPTSEFFERLPGLLEKRHRLYMTFGRDPVFEGRVNTAIESLKAEVRRGAFGPWEVIDPRTILWEMRLLKTPYDLERIEMACKATAEGVRAAMLAVMPGMCERELAAVVEFEFRRRGSERVAFETICAAGANATTLHYVKNNATIQANDLVLVDAGCEIDYVSADITRTFPASGKFTEPGLSVYRWVLRAQEAAISAIKPGATYAQVHEAGLEVLCRGLKAMGVLKGSVKSIVEEGAYKPFFMHRIGHWLGSDVHDVGLYFEDGKSMPLRPGMVMTVEPGLYFGESAPEPLRGIGVRIEDDLLVTEDGPRVLTADVPKDPREIEELMQDQGSWWRTLGPITVETASDLPCKSPNNATSLSGAHRKKGKAKSTR